MSRYIGYDVEIPNEPASTTRPPTSARPVPIEGYRSAQDIRDAEKIISRLPPTCTKARKSRIQSFDDGKNTVYRFAKNNPFFRERDYSHSTNVDKQIAPSLKTYLAPRPRLKLHWSLIAIGGMCSVLLLLFVYVHLYAWWTNDIYQPSHYTQAANLNKAVITIPGHTIQGTAFVDANNHLDVLVITDGDASKAKVMLGPLVPLDHPQQADLYLKPQGSNFTATATRATTTQIFSYDPQTFSWTTQDVQTGGR